jgi:molybdate transport system substrate-binding protein
MSAIHILSGGAAQGLVRTCAPAFEAQHGVRIDGTFGAVGAMKAKLLDGAPCDILILTRALIEGLVASGHAQAASVHDVGIVKTGVAVKTGQPHPNVSDADSLRAVLRQATGIYFPDPELATAGIHFMKVLHGLGIVDEVHDRLRTFANGATAMKAMADCDDPHVVGCTQVTEILITPGVDLVADLPKAFELATVYTAAVTTQSAHATQAAALIAELVSPHRAADRKAGGFLALDA